MRRILTLGASIVLLIVTTLAIASPWANARRLDALSQMSRIVATARGTLEVAEEGSGPAVLVLHGTPGGYDAGLMAAHAAFPPDTHLISVSRAGYLRTGLGLAKTPEAQADLYASMLAQMGVARVTVFAFSGGGPFGLAFAERHPERCRGLILAAAISRRFDEQPKWLPAVFRVTDLVSWWMLPLFPKNGTAGLFRTITPVGARLAGWNNDVAVMAQMPREFEGRIYRPTLILHGTADEQASIEQSDELARRIPGSKLVRVEGATHLSLFSSDAARAAIREFVR